jgi:hypothetical protein
MDTENRYCADYEHVTGSPGVADADACAEIVQAECAFPDKFNFRAAVRGGRLPSHTALPHHHALSAFPFPYGGPLYGRTREKNGAGEEWRRGPLAERRLPLRHGGLPGVLPKQRHQRAPPPSVFGPPGSWVLKKYMS